MDLKKYIRSIPDYPKKGILFRDITTLIKDPKAFKFTNDKIIEIAEKMQFDKVAAIESRGFIFASTVSYALNKPFILLRKKNKLPAKTYSVDFTLEYGEATIEVHRDSINSGEKILVIDDLIATGGTAEAAAKLIKISGGVVAGFIFVINLFDLPGNKLLKDKGFETKCLIEFPGH
jgi:adenine phosphoribosyltransferase